MTTTPHSIGVHEQISQWYFHTEISHSSNSNHTYSSDINQWPPLWEEEEEEEESNLFSLFRC